MMKKIFWVQIWTCLLVMLFVISAPARELVFEGKVSAQVVRDVSLPFPIIVDKVFAKIGDNVTDGQRLLEYHLREKDMRGIQNELMNAGNQADYQARKSALEAELNNQNNRARLSSQLAAKNLGPQEDAALQSRNLRLIQNRLRALKEQEQTAQSDFAIRLDELESYFGQKLKPGQRLPKDLYMTSPINGTIISMSSRARPMSELTGVAFTIAVLNPVQVQFLVHESEITNLYVGQKAVIEIPNRKDQKFQGTVSMLSWKPTDETVATPSFYTVWVDAHNPDHYLKPGYKVLVHVDLGDK